MITHLRARSIAATLIAAFALVAGGGACGDDAATKPDGAHNNTAAPAGSVTLSYRMADVWGDPPSEAARTHIAGVLADRLTAIGESRAGVAIDGTDALKITVTASVADKAMAAIEQRVELRFRIRAPSEIENMERSQRDELREFYTSSRADFAWFPLGTGEDVYIYVPEAPRILEIENLHAATPRDEELIRQKTVALQELLLQRVFTGADLADAEAIHRPGDSAVRVTIRAERRDAFRKYTTHYTGRQMIVLVDGRVIAAPTLTEPLEAAAELRKPGGTYSPAEADRVAAALRRAAYGIRLTRVK